MIASAAGNEHSPPDLRGTRRLWSLWDMLKNYAFGSFQAGVVLRFAESELHLEGHIHDGPNEDALVPEDLTKLLAWTLGETQSLALAMDLDSVPPKIERIRMSLQGIGQGATDIEHQIRDLRERVQDQLESRMFLYVPANKAAYFQEPTLFGQEVADRFARVIDDIEDAGKCLALGQGTATVLHLMRVMEEGLKALAGALKIPYAPSWESYIKQITDKVSLKHKAKGIKWRRDEPFFKEVLGDLMAVKIAWRNPTMHVGRKYSPEEAEEIFKAVRRFMQRLVKKLNGGSGV